MQSYLQDLYHGSICPIASRQGVSWDKEAFCDILKERAPELEKKFNALMSDIRDAYVTDTEGMFFQGFGLAVKLITEALAQ